MKRFLALIGYIILFVIATIVFLLSIGTIFTGIPYIGSIANIITVSWLHLWLPLCIVLSLIALGLCLANRKKPARWVTLALSVVSLAATVFFLGANASALGQYGVEPNVFLSKEDLSAVRVETYPYTQSEYGAVNLRGTSMSERAKLIISVAHPDFREQLTADAVSLGLLPS